MEYLGTRIDSERNNVRGKEQEISAEGSKVKIFVIPTNEEIMIARDTPVSYTHLDVYKRQVSVISAE